MNFQDLQELLRLEVLRRIETGDLTGTRLAQQTGFRQAHISNYLNKKRALSLEGLDRVLAAQGLTVNEILPVYLGASAETPADPDTDLEAETILRVPLVSASAAAEEGQFQAANVIETVPVAVARLSENRARPSGRSLGWQRFVALRLDAQQAAAMEPLLASGTLVVIDRHYNSPAPYRAHQPTVFAVRWAGGLLFRYVQFEEGRLILRPLEVDCGIQLLPVGARELASDYIVGRVCLLIQDV